MTTSSSLPIGFIGLGVMGEPIALNLLRAGTPLVVWNRTLDKTERLQAAGAQVAADVGDVFRQSKIVILMLADSCAIDAVLGRPAANASLDLFAEFQARVAQHTIIHMGTTSAEYSKALEADIRRAGGRYVEAPVSGSRKPAETGELVLMLAGESEAVAEVRPLLQPMCHEDFLCGVVPNALLMKLSVNLYLITVVAGVAEATHFASSHHLDLNLFRDILNAGPMASGVSRMKIDKLVARDFSVQASVHDGLKNNRLIAEAARAANLASPLLDICHTLFKETLALGHGQDDIATIIRAMEARTQRERSPLSCQIEPVPKSETVAVR
jgi:3-hydroxyisobutyrate dehydrogenase